MRRPAVRDEARKAKPKASDSIKGGAQTIKDNASKLSKQASVKAREYAQDGKARAGGALDEVSRLMGDAANSVR